MYGGQGNGNNAKPPPWLVRAEVTIRHGAPGASDPGQSPLGVSSRVGDSGGVRMVYRWNTSQESGTAPGIPVTTANPTPSPGSFGFQRGNILFTSTPPPRPQPGSFTIPRSGSSGNDDSVSSRGRGTNISDSGYNSEQFSPQSYSSLPARRPSQQYNRRCKSTCSIVLSNAGADSSAERENSGKILTGSEPTRHSHDESLRHRPAHQHLFPRYQFTTVPEVCEDCAEGNARSASTTHFCTRLREKFGQSPTTTSKDAASQTTDIESRGSSSTISKPGKIRRKGTGLCPSDEQRRKKPENESPSTPTGTTGSGPPDSEKSDSSARDDSSKRKSRTVHIDVYCTGSDEDASSTSASEDERDTPVTVFENPDVKVTHTQATGNVLPRGFEDEKAFLKRASERRCESFKHAPMRMPSLASSKGYDSDDLLSSLYPSQFSSYTALQGIDSAPWSAASSNAAIPFDYDSTIATSAKDTFSDIESVLNNRTNLTPCDSFEYANTSDRERIRRMEEVWTRSEKPKDKTWRSPHIERRQLLQSQKVREYLESHSIAWSSEDTEDDSDESVAVGWSFLPSDEKPPLKKNSTIRRASRPANETQEKEQSARNVTKDESVTEDEPSSVLENRPDSATRTESVFHPYAPRIGPFGSNSPSPLPSKVPSRVTSPFTTPQGEKTDHILKASRFGPVISAFRKPGHHIGPSKNPSCSCEHCRRYFEEIGLRGRAQSATEFGRPVNRAQNDNPSSVRSDEP